MEKEREMERERESITNLGGAEKRKSDRRDDPGFWRWAIGFEGCAWKQAPHIPDQGEQLQTRKDRKLCVEEMDKGLVYLA